MAKTPAEIELDHFWRGTDRYEAYGFSDESGHEAAKVFLDRNIVIPRSELPAIEEEDGCINAPADYHARIREARNGGAWGVTMTAEGHRLVAALELARAEHRGAQERREADAKEAEATAARDKRRDELAGEFTAVNSYGGQLPYTQNLINRIIELEGATK